MRDDIFGGLRNALERGTSLDTAIMSFVNAGYNETEVREAAKMLEGSAVTFTTQQPARLPALSATQVRQPAQKPMSARPTFEVKTPRQRPSLLIIVLSIILLLSIVSFVMSLLFKKQIADFLGQFLSG